MNGTNINNVTHNDVEVRLLRTVDEITSALQIQYHVFVKELAELRTMTTRTDDDISTIQDSWDSISHYAGLFLKDKLVGAGRLIWKPGDLGFRVSSSICLSKFFADETSLCEVSALSVLPEFRHCGYAAAIHWYRLLLAKTLQASYMIASTSLDAAQFFQTMGFKVLEQAYKYKHYVEDKSIGSFLSLDLKDETSTTKYVNYVAARCGEGLSRKVMRCFKSDMEIGLDYLPISGL
ncbi:hypothetical protein CEE37_11570 [candidate division LCP-89 bacterium B3_LCP]|uniref:N-acetyltransferase domain-containing protein n=1 Tax=candidate division LCP-89 bacterium B3_LCP TaxID=2012998 RepID=A0A532UVT9_UNCL8|nr:MAG: hypothetical protein CEE37_11570 [candidate division LCP-89 bacterium B3_LCP]